MQKNLAVAACKKLFKKLAKSEYCSPYIIKLHFSETSSVQLTGKMHDCILHYLALFQISALNKIIFHGRIQTGSRLLGEWEIGFENVCLPFEIRLSSPPPVLHPQLLNLVSQ